ncbi:hypothetical protein GCM10025867_26850 [Frondihabitans sucicola]|uniref:Pentapeptide repeat-containing protein n=1 Tax=Frondihabitans sucicola TaxID=1268041 RepID=A0ABM8GQA3_9MICO|nr:hypothetical protein GCM10025867_26850 [Frondihabitans sucicola]
MGAIDRRLQERRGDGELGGLDGSVGAARGADAHERGSCALHHALDVGEVEVDQAGRRDEVGDALHTGEEYLVGRAEGLDHRDAALGDLEQAVVRDDDEGVDLVFQRSHTSLGLRLTTLALETEGLRDDTDRQRADRLRDASDHGSAAGAGAAAFARGHEHHVGAGKCLFDLFRVVFRRAPADLGVGTGSEAARQFASDVELDVGVAQKQRLRVGVDGDELDAAESELDHAVDGVDATAADTDDLDHG